MSGGQRGINIDTLRDIHRLKDQEREREREREREKERGLR